MAAKTAQPNMAKYFLPYQARFIQDRAKHVLVEKGRRTGFTYATAYKAVEDCVAQCENILSIDRLQLDLSAGPVGILDESALWDVIRAIGYVLKADCEPV